MDDDNYDSNIPLTYGSTIYLSPQGDADYFVYSDGFVKTTLSLRLNDRGKPGSTFNRCLFKIYPSFSNSTKKEALNIDELFSKNAYSEAKKQEMAEDLKDRLASEFKFNVESFEKVQGKPISFDQPVQFLHVASNKFLCLFSKEADIERENYKLELVEYPSDWTVFKFSPSFKHQKESEGVIYQGDFVHITSVQMFRKKTPYLHTSTASEEDTNSAVKTVLEENYNESPDFQKSVRLVPMFKGGRAEIETPVETAAKNATGTSTKNKITKREVNASIETSIRWQIQIFTQPNYEPDFLAYGDVIWINNADANCTLITRKDANEFPVVEFIEAIHTDQFQHYVGHTNGMWIIENVNPCVGGSVKWEQSFRLKSLTSGLYLSARRDANGRYLVCPDSYDNSNNLWRFAPVPTTFSGKDPAKRKTFVPKDAFLLVLTDRAESTSPLLRNDAFSVPIEPYYLRLSNLKPILEKELDEHDTCRINKANMNEVWETNFLVSCFPRLKKYLDFVYLHRKDNDQVYTTNKIANKLDKKIRKILKILEILSNFTLNKSLLSSPDQKYGQPNEFRQKLLREQYFISVLVEILNKSMTIEEIQRHLEIRSTRKKPPSKKKATLAELIRKKGLVASDSKKNSVEARLLELKADVIKEIFAILPKICQGNPNNQKHLFDLLPQIKFLIISNNQVKYFDEAVDFLINVIGNNEDLLIEISEDWKYDLSADPSERFKIEEEKDNFFCEDMEGVHSIKRVSVFNVEIEFGHRHNRRLTSSKKAHYDINKNLVRYMMKVLTTKTADRQKIMRFLRFFSCLSSCEGRGMSINQEILYNILNANERIRAKLFIPSKIVNGNFMIQIDNNELIDINDCFKDGRIIKYEVELEYFQEQLKFFSDLLLDRNYLWKSNLEDSFPIEYVFKQIYNQNLSLSLRAVFCQLVVALYIDHEPLYEVTKPLQCRVFKVKSILETVKLAHPAMERFKSNNNFDMMQEVLLSSLLEEILKIISATKQKIREELNQKFGAGDENAIDAQVTDYLNNELVQKVVYLMLKLSKFDVFRLIKKIDMYPQFIRELFALLEYDQVHPALTYLLATTRNTNFKKIAKANKKNSVLRAFSSVVDNVTDLGKGLASIVTSTVFGAKKERKAAKVLGTDAEDSNMGNNPLLKGLLSLISTIDVAVKGVKLNTSVVESKIKEQISEILNHTIDQRQDFLIQNFLCWFDDILVKEGRRLSNATPLELTENLMGYIDAQALSVLPPTMKTGMPEIDEKYTKGRSENLLSGMKKLVKKVGGTRASQVLSFTNYTGGDEFPDLDRLIREAIVQDNKQKGMEALPVLLATFVHADDTKLEHHLLDVIMRSFSQKEELGNFLKDLDVLFSENDIQSYYRIKAQVEEMRFLIERSEIWLAAYALKGEKQTEVEEIIYQLNQMKFLFMKPRTDASNPLQRAIMKQRVSSTKGMKPSRSHQNIFRSLKGHVTIFELLQNGMFHLKQACRQKNTPSERKDKLKQIFETAYDCLTLFCKKNETNQRLLCDKLKLFLMNLDYELGQIPLICEMCKDNKFVCEAYGEQILNCIVELIEKKGRKPHYLDPLITLQCVKGVPIFENQMIIFNKLLPNFRALSMGEQEVLYAKERDVAKDIYFLFKKNAASFIASGDDVLADEPGAYHAKLLDVFLLVAKGSEKMQFSHPRLRKAFPLYYLLDLLTSSDVFDENQQSNDPEITGVGEVHLETNRSDQFSFKSESFPRPSPEQISMLRDKIIELIQIIYLSSDNRVIVEWDMCHELLVNLLVLEHKRISSLSEKNPYMTFYLEYFFDKFLPFVASYIQRVLLESQHSDLTERVDTQLFNQLVRTILDKMHIVGRFFKEGTLSTLQMIARINDEQTYNALFNEKFLQAEQKSFDAFLETDKNATIQQVTTHPEESKSANEGVKSQWQTFVELFVNNKIYQSEVENERLALSEAIVNFEKYISPEALRKYRLPTITLKDIAKKLIKFLKTGLSEDANIKTMIRTMNVLIKIIEEAPDKKSMQDFMDKEEAMETILSVLSDSNYLNMPDELLDTFLKFGITLLDGGNSKVQKTIYNHCLAVTRSEIMFKRFYTLIQDQITKLKAVQESQQDDKDEDEKRFTDSFYLREFEEKTKREEKLADDIVKKVLRFLQLFTEGHYLELQNYLRSQKNNAHSYNLVAIISELLLAYSSNMMQKDYENIIKCLDTLTEFVQGPCPENQIALIDGKFLEVAYKILSKETKKTAQKDEYESLNASFSSPTLNTQTPLISPLPTRRSISKVYTKLIMRNDNKTSDMLGWQIAQLKYKCMILVNSLWESNQKTKTIGQIMRAIPLDVLKRNIAEIYKQYKDMYGTNCTLKAFGHHAFNPDEDDDKNRTPEFFELIIETGFSIYFLIQTYIEANVQDSDIDFLDEINELEDELRVTTKAVKGVGSLLRNNIISDLGRFGVQLLQSSLSTVSSVKKNVEKGVKKAIKFKLAKTEEEKKALQEVIQLKNAIEYRERIKEGLEFFAKNSAHIEVIRNNNIEKVQFILMPYHKELPKEVRTRFHEKVDRISLKSKITGLIEAAPEMMKVARHELTLKEFFAKNKFIAIFTNFVNLWKDLAFLLSIVLNIFILASFSSTFKLKGETIEHTRVYSPVFFQQPWNYTPEDTFRIFDSMGISMLLCSCFVCLFFMLKKLPLLLKEIWVDSPGTALQKQGIVRRIAKFISRLVITIFRFVQNAEVMYYLGYSLFAIFGLTIHKFFFAYHLLEVLVRFPTLKNVLRSLWEPKEAILLTIILMLIVQYVFSLFAFQYLFKDFDGYCNSTLMCFLSNIDFTFKGNGGVGGILTEYNNENSTEYYNAGRFIFDYLMTMLVFFLMISILAGIIIDTFGSLRESEGDKQRDIDGFCFICGHSRETFERQADTSTGYITHIKLEHYMWNYAFYIDYIKSKDTTEYTGMESYIREKLDRGDISWFPLHRARSLKGIQESEAANYQKIHHSFADDLEEIKSGLRQMTEMFGRLKSESSKKLEKKERTSAFAALTGLTGMRTISSKATLP